MTTTDAPTPPDHDELLVELIATNKELTASNKAAVVRLDEERYWRTQKDRSNVRWKRAVLVVALAFLLTLGALAGLVLQGRHTQQDNARSLKILSCIVQVSREHGTDPPEQQRAAFAFCIDHGLHAPN